MCVVFMLFTPPGHMVKLYSLESVEKGHVQIKNVTNLIISWSKVAVNISSVFCIQHPILQKL
jgi:hypothetical protein